MSTVAPPDTYALGYESDEFDRLMRQARWLDELSEPLLMQAGLDPGMRVLDIGSGAGDVSLLASRIVGAAGSVLGVDRSPESVELATRRATALGVENVSFAIADADDLPGNETFDAVIGRLVLMYLPDVAATLARLARRVRPGGIITFQEYDIDAMTCVPVSALVETTFDQVRHTFRRLGASTRMGLMMPSAFVAAGLPRPVSRMLGRLDTDPDGETLHQFVAITRALLPGMVATGVATAEDVDIETLHSRMVAELGVTGSTVLPPPLIGSWSQLPPG